MGEFRDVIFRCNTDVDVVNAKKIGLKNGYEVPSYSRGYNSIVSCRYIIFSYVKEDGSKMILTWEDNPSYTPEYIIDEQLQYNKGDYKYTDNIDELNFLLVQNNAKFINYNKPTKLVYESLGKPNFIIYKPQNESDCYKIQEYLFNKDYTRSSGSKAHLTYYSSRHLIISLDYKKIMPYDGNYEDAKEHIWREYQGNPTYTDSFKECIFMCDKKIDYNTPTKLVYEDGMQVLKYDQFDNLEYRKGSIEFGGILTKLLEFLRLYKDDLVGELKFTITDFEKHSNIKIDLVKKLIGSKENGQKLYDFSISIENDSIYFNDLNKNGKSRPFESNIY